jgi:hypothetical protein
MKQRLWAFAKRLPRLFLEAYGLLFLISVLTTPASSPLADEIRLGALALRRGDVEGIAMFVGFLIFRILAIWGVVLLWEDTLGKKKPKAAGG